MCLQADSIEDFPCIENLENKPELFPEKPYNFCQQELASTQRVAFETAQQIQSGPNGFSASPSLINAPGNYTLIDDLVIPANQNGIIIDADNVILELNSRSISGLMNSLNAILIINNHTNITIRNGIIRNMGGNGIFVNSRIQGLVISNIRLANNNGNGISVASGRNCIVQDCFAINNRLNGIAFFNSGTIISQTILISLALTSFNGGDGIQLNGCFNSFLFDCLSHNNNNNGFSQLVGNRIAFNRCQANNNNTHGFLSTGNNHNFVTCIASNNRLQGFLINGGQQNIRECEAKSNGNNGFQVDGNNNILIDSTSSNNTGNGFTIMGNQHSVSLCIATSNTNGFSVNNINHCILNNEAKTNSSNGIVLQANTSQCQVRDNTTIANLNGLANNSTALVTNKIYSNFSSDNTNMNFIGVPNTFTSPTALSAINFTANIEN